MTIGITSKQQAALDAVEKFDTQKQAAKHLGIGDSTLSGLLKSAREKLNQDPLIKSAGKALGLSNTDMMPYFWAKSSEPDENGIVYSGMVHNPATGEDVSFLDMAKEAIDYAKQSAPEYEMRPIISGGNLLKISLADVHVGKLCVKSETGYEYNQDIAVHRMVEGTKTLLRKSKGHGISHTLYVLGNDILHVDNARGTTTSGTPQDTDGTVQTMFNAARTGLVKSIEECAKVSDVTLAFNPSNHDWLMGWALAQTIGAHFSNHPHVLVHDYYLSERHRKYFRFEMNLLGLSHGDGAKESDLGALMLTEAREHMSECDLLYWYLDHFHHKIRKTAGLNPNRLEKDLTGMTVISGGQPRYRGDGPEIEYVRSPSPPDGWHDRNGYVNRQAVECYIHHPYDGQEARFTSWF